MPYHKNKQQAFQAAHQGFTQVQDAYLDVVRDSSDYGSQLKHLRQEVLEAYKQIDNALETASEHQYDQLKHFQYELGRIVDEVKSEE